MTILWYDLEMEVGNVQVQLREIPNLRQLKIYLVNGWQWILLHTEVGVNVCFKVTTQMDTSIPLQHCDYRRCSLRVCHRFNDTNLFQSVEFHFDLITKSIWHRSRLAESY